MSQKRRRRDRTIHPGDLVYILSGLPSKQVAIYEGRFDPKGKRIFRSRAEGTPPRFRLKDNTSIHGYECWWIRLRTAIEVAKGLGPEGAEELRRLYAARNEFRGYD